jgi:hypothetical protein
MANDEPKSHYSKLEVPKFESKIPPHLLNRLDDQSKWLVETLSRLDQRTDWLTQVQVKSNEESRDTDVRLTKVERFTGKWAVIGAGAMLVFTASLGAGIKMLFEKLFP